MNLPNGYRVRYRHERRYDEISGLSPKGGVTHARILDAEGNEIASGQAICRPDENYNKRLGRMVALGRALKQLAKEDTHADNHAR